MGEIPGLIEQFNNLGLPMATMVVMFMISWYMITERRQTGKAIGINAEREKMEAETTLRMIALLENANQLQREASEQQKENAKIQYQTIEALEMVKSAVAHGFDTMGTQLQKHSETLTQHTDKLGESMTAQRDWRDIVITKLEALEKSVTALHDELKPWVQRLPEIEAKNQEHAEAIGQLKTDIIESKQRDTQDNLPVVTEPLADDSEEDELVEGINHDAVEKPDISG